MKKDNTVRIIFHIDMNAFFCSVACNLNPSLRGKAFAIGRENTYRGVLSTASYEARKYGIHAAMPVADAYKIMPDLMIINIDYKHYEEYHHKFINIIKQYSNIVEVASIDECYVDVTEISKTKHPLVLAHEIQLRILKELNLSCSIGIAPTLFLAKMASDIKKPLGITVLRKREVQDVLYKLSVKEIFGIGKKTYPRLIDNGINTIGDFMAANNKDKIINLIGEHSYNYVCDSVSGNSTNIVDPNRYANSTSFSLVSTYDVYLSDIDEILYELRKMSKQIHNRLKDSKSSCKTIGITLRDTEFKTINRSKSVDNYTDDLYDINNIIADLLEENYIEKQYRLIGVFVSNIVLNEDIEEEYNLFTINDKILKLETINNMISTFQEKYGKNSLFRKKDNNK